VKSLEISIIKGEIKGRFELILNWCSHIVGRAAGGQTPKAIADDLNVSPIIIKNTIYQSDSHNKMESLCRCLLCEVHAYSKI
jgi:hypothetical protein